MVARTVRSVLPPLSFPALFHAKPNGSSCTKRYRHGRAGPSGDGIYYRSPAYPRSLHGGNRKSGLGAYYIDHTVGIWPQAAGGIPFNACEFQSKGDPLTDLFEDLAAEQKARATYDNILRVVRNIPEIADPIRFLRAREVVHFQRFGEALRSVQEQLDSKNFYAFNPSFDMPCEASCKKC